jgi:acyl carrier protein
MDRSEIREFIMGMLKEKLSLFDINESEVKGSFDFVKSGLLDSMAFVDLITSLEEKYKVEIDFEELTESSDFTSLDGLTNYLLKL